MVAAAICIGTMHFMTRVLNRGHNIPTKFVDNRSNDKREILLRNSRWRWQPCWILITLTFQLHVCILYQSRKIFTKFSIDLSNTKKMTNVFRNWGWWRPSFWILATMHFQCKRYVLNLSPNVSTISLVRIGQIVNKWQQLFEIPDGGGRRIELWLRRFFVDVTDLYDLNQSSNIPTKFSDDWSNSKEIATVFF